MPIIQTNLKPLQVALGDALVAELVVMFGEEANMLDGDVRKIAGRMAVAARRSKPELAEECREQLMMLVLEAELEAREGAEDLFSFFMNGTTYGFGGLFQVAAAALKTLSVAG
jgi:hypothetical protein